MAVFNAIHLGQTMPTERINNMNVNLSTLSISPGIDPFFQTNNLGNTILQGTRSARNWHCQLYRSNALSPPTVSKSWEFGGGGVGSGGGEGFGINKLLSSGGTE
jgi:hypothetical protein